MLRLTLRSLAAKKFRLLSTVAAIVLGVAFLVGTLILSATMDRTFSSAIADINAGVDVVVRGTEAVDAGAEAGPGGLRTNLPASVLDEVRATDGVAAAEPGYQGEAQVLGADGKVLDLQNSIGLNWIDDDELSTFSITEGAAPEAGQVVLGDDAAEAAGVGVGDQVDVITAAGREPYEVAGIAESDGETAFGSIAFTFFSDADAEARLGTEGTVPQVLVRAEGGVDPAQLRTTIAEELGAAAGSGAEVISGDDYRAEQQDLVSGITTVFQNVLLVFAGISLLVGTFTIANTFAITVAQRTRELALVRAIGGSRRQVRGMVLLEAAIVGLVGSAVGVLAGIGTAKALLAALGAAGLSIPGALAISASTVATGLVVGLLVTVGAALVSARKAAGVAPVAAMRDAVVEPTGAPRGRTIAGALAAVVAVGTLAAGVSASSSSLAGLGALLALVAALLLGPALVRLAMAVAGRPLRRSGVVGRLAVANAGRNPRRSASTAAALVIGVMLVIGASMFASTAQETISGDIESTIAADRVIRPAGSSTGIPASIGEEVAGIDGATSVAVRDAFALVGGSTQAVAGIDVADADGLLELTVVDGELTGAEGTVAVASDLADEQGWAVGDQLDVTYSSGASASATLVGTFEETSALASVLLPYDEVAASGAAPLDALVLVSGDDAALGQVADAVADAPTAVDDDVAGYASAQAGALDTVLSLVLGFLGLAVVIAVLGIATTISLSVRERTRELGVLRSIGMTRRQLKRTIRLEAVSLSAVGALLGAVLGLGATWALLQTLGDEGFAAPVLPTGTLVAVVVGAVLAGVVAAALPARRAARMAVLDAVRSE